MGIKAGTGTPEREVTLTGVLVCTPSDIDLVLGELPDHIRLTRAEPGCIAFEVRQSSDDPSRFEVSERFADRAAFEAHQLRTRESRWGRLTRHIPREYQITGGDA